MSQLLGWLSGGDLRSDGMANEAAEFVLQNPDLLDELFAGLRESDDVIRGRTADALEKVARARPDLLVDRLGELIAVVESDKLPMVRWHVAMILGHLACYEEVVDQVTPTLLGLLEDGSVFVRSWAIVSLCIIGRKYPGCNEQIVNQVGPLQADPSVAIRSKARKAVKLLTDETVSFPEGWIKSRHLNTLQGELS